MGIEIRLLFEADLPAALRLSDLANWNQTEADWRRLIQLEPNGCFCATSNGAVVATTTTTTYGSDLAWIGMVLVDAEYRRQGIATRLMERALAYLNEKNVATVKLDATPIGRPVYENLGFTQQSLIERWNGVAETSAKASLASDNELLKRIVTMDHREFGADRSALIGQLIEEASTHLQSTTDVDGRLTGFALARPGRVATYIGPVLAEGTSEASVLLDGLLDQVVGRSVYVDLNTDFQGGSQILSDRGFAKQRDLIRMSYGKNSSASSSPLIFAIAGPEVG